MLNSISRNLKGVVSDIQNQPISLSNMSRQGSIGISSSSPSSENSRSFSIDEEQQIGHFGNDAEPSSDDLYDEDYDDDDDDEDESATLTGLKKTNSMNKSKAPLETFEEMNKKSKVRSCLAFLRFRFIIILSFLLLIILMIHLYVKLTIMQDDYSSLNADFMYKYSIESLTKDVNIIPVHSHNDEWRKIPFFHALRIGSNSIEADVWLLEDKPDLIYVGHSRTYLSEDKNLDEMYLDRFFTLLQDVNNRELKSSHSNSTGEEEVKSTEPKKGIFYNSPERTTYFYLDIKKNNVLLMQALEKKLQKFLDLDYLTTYNTVTGEYKEGPLTVIITGDYPLEYISSKELLYTFIDAPLHKLLDKDTADLYPANKISLFASASLFQLTGYNKALNYFGGLSKTQIADVTKYINAAHDLGLKVRIWETPSWPLAIRNKVWRQIIELGIDYLNVDDLRGAAKFF